MGMFEVVGERNSDFEGLTFAQCTNRALAEKALKILQENFAEEGLEIRESNLRVNTVVLDDQEIDLTA